MSNPYHDIGPIGACENPFGDVVVSEARTTYSPQVLEDMLLRLQTGHNTIINIYQKMFNHLAENLAKCEQRMMDIMSKSIEPMVQRLNELETAYNHKCLKCTDKLILSFTPIHTQFLEMEQRYGEIISVPMETESAESTEEPNQETTEEPEILEEPEEEPTPVEPIETPKSPSGKKPKCQYWDICPEGFAWQWFHWVWQHLHVWWKLNSHKIPPNLLGIIIEILQRNSPTTQAAKPDTKEEYKKIAEMLNGVFAVADLQPVMTEAEALETYGEEDVAIEQE